MNIREALRRADWLRELDGLLRIAVMVCIVLGIANVIAAFTGRPFDVGIPGQDVLRTDALTNVRPDVTLDPSADISLRPGHPSGTQLILVTLSTLPTYVLTTIAVLLLWRLVSVARHTDPFTDATARRLRTLGWLLVIGGPTSVAVQFVARFALSYTVTTIGPQATLNLGTLATWFLAGFGMLAISEVVRRGTALRTELDEVV